LAVPPTHTPAAAGQGPREGGGEAEGDGAVAYTLSLADGVEGR